MSNLYRYLRELAAPPALQIATVVAVDSTGANTSTVEFPAGSRQVVRGTIVAVGSPAFIQAGVIQSVAPSRDPVVIEI